MTVALVEESFEGRAAFDTAVSRALMLRAARGEIPETLRLYRPDRIVAFGRQDSRAKGFHSAAKQAKALGYQSVIRLAGGRAAVFHEETIAFARSIPDPDPTARTFARFQETADLMAAALTSLRVDARIGEIAGEYCPGDYSINARGKKKLVGIGQRIIAGAAHVGGVIVVSRPELVTSVLLPVYRELDLEWDEATAGDVMSECGADWQAVKTAVIAQFSTKVSLEPQKLDEATLELAAQFEQDHSIRQD